MICKPKRSARNTSTSSARPDCTPARVCPVDCSAMTRATTLVDISRIMGEGIDWVGAKIRVRGMKATRSAFAPRTCKAEVGGCPHLFDMRRTCRSPACHGDVTALLTNTTAFCAHLVGRSSSRQKTSRAFRRHVSGCKASQQNVECGKMRRYPYVRHRYLSQAEPPETPPDPRNGTGIRKVVRQMLELAARFLIEISC